MLSVQENDASKILEFSVHGKVTLDEMEEFISTVEPRFNEWDEIKILKEVHTIGGIELKALWEDLKMSSRLITKVKKIKKVAVVADQFWTKHVVKVMQFGFWGEIKAFNLSEKDEARQWLESA